MHRRTDRPRTSDRDGLEGIVFVLSAGIGWAELPIVDTGNDPPERRLGRRGADPCRIPPCRPGANCDR
jgi:hypothetical protein